MSDGEQKANTKVIVPEGKIPKPVKESGGNDTAEAAQRPYKDFHPKPGHMKTSGPA